MELHGIDIAIIAAYLAAIIALGIWLSRRASKNLEAYFLGGKSLPWWVIGTSHGASGFDITGTMWFVTMMFTYGLKAAFIPWIWPLFDRVFRQVYLGAWIRKSGVLTGAEWMRTRFGTGIGGNLAHLSVVVYALVATVGFLGYAFQGIGKFADVFFRWDLSLGPFTSPEMYGIIILLLTTAYLLLGGWYSVVLTDLLQFALLAVASIFIAGVAMARVSPEALSQAVPDGWSRLFFGWRLDLDWSGIVEELNRKILDDGFSWFGLLISMMLLRGLLVSMAGPTPGYGIQHVLSTRNPREAALENWWMSIVQLIPRFLMIAGITVLGLVYFMPQIKEQLGQAAAAAAESGGKMAFDFEQVLPYVIRDFIPVGVVGLLMAGLLAAFMSTFDSTVNAGAAYVVNDIYKRYMHPGARERTYVRLSYAVTLLLVIIAIAVGMQIRSIHEITGWITGLLYGGYIAPNVLKWHWWRFNGPAYFAGMIGGIAAALAFPWIKALYPGLNPHISFVISFVASVLASGVVCLITRPDDEAVLRKFYRDVRPWGFWRPIREAIAREDPSIQANRNLGWDAFNVANGIVWQLMLMVVPVCLVIREWTTFWISLVILIATSVIMKLTWYDRLEPADDATKEAEEATS
ncbi:MAG: Na+:solute symporter [Planctomycetes bacterium]|nr:Na+:solute symporter [Planctomycetota bacterium]